MNNCDWIQGLHTEDTKLPMESVKGETIYTLFLHDFLHMPPIDYGVLSDFDPQIKSLLN